MKKYKILWTITLVLFLLLVAAEIMLGTLIHRLNMLPSSYFAVAVLALVIVAVGIGLLGLLGMNSGMTRKIIACVLSVIMILVCLFLWTAGNQVYHTVEQITTPAETVPSRAVFVRAEDPAQTLADTIDYRYGIVTDYDEESCRNVLLTVEETLETTLAVTWYEAPSAMVDALRTGEADAVILSSGYLTLLEEEEGFEDIAKEIRILEQIPLVDRPAETEPAETTEATEPTTEPVVEQNITNTPFVVYISGLDMRGQKLGVSRSDVNILAVINPNTKQILLINTPRDYYVPHPDSSQGTRDKLTHLGIYGIDCSIRGLEALYGLQISYYAQLNFSGFETLIDELGGVTIYSDRAFTAYDDFDGPHYIQKGQNQLDGRAALAFARDRYHQAAGDNDRGKNQMKVIQAVIQKATSGTTIISNYSGILASMSGMFHTSLSMDDLSLLVKMQLTDMAQWNVLSYAVIGTGDSRTTYSMPNLRAYVMHPNEDSVALATELANRVIAGEILTQEDTVFQK